MKKRFALILASLFLANCSTHQEIKPYELSENNTLELPESPLSTTSDSIFNETVAIEDGYYDDSVPPEFDDRVDVVGVSSDQEDVVAPKKAIKISSPSRGLASTLKNGLYSFSKNCTMRTAPEADSSDAGKVALGKQLWLDVHNAQWFKAYKKSGVVYVPVNCVE